MGRMILLLTALVFVALGACFVSVPVRMASFVDIVADQPAAIADIRAVYGGMQIGFGVFLAWCGLSIPRVRTGLLAALMVLIGLATARIIGIADSPSQPMVTFLLLASEILGIVLVATGIVVGAEKSSNA